ncbi:hypothetical protein [Nocardioides litoris]|uniref:hypothetical protein n=1 Tax=Nocardioides litoris TaxID=1926648 RepID=UPI001123AEC4|nr:hypothetical protein [Nocardioides litoris]
MPPPRRHLTSANTASATALAVAHAGSGAAVAAGLAPGSVRSAQIANGQVKTRDLAAKAVTGAKVAPDTLTGADVRESTLNLPPASRVHSGNAAAGVTTLLSSGPAVEVATVDAVAPARGFLVVTADASLAGGSAGAFVYTGLYDGSRLLANNLWSPGGPGGTDWVAQSSTVTVPVAAGQHRLRLTLSPSSGSAKVYLQQLTALFVPAGAAGAPPAAD